MQYTKHLVAAVTLSFLSISLVSAADVAAGTTTVASTGVTAGSVVVPTTTSATSLEMKGAPRLIKKTSDSVTLEWDAVPSASAYIVKYSKTSVANSTDPNAQYDNETDQVTATGVVITKLSSSNEKLAPATSYYFSVVAIDKEGKESDTFSDELMVTTEATGSVVSAATGSVVSATAATLAIKDLVVTDDRTLTLSFNSALSSDPVRVKITKTSDNSDIPVGAIVPDSANPNAVVVNTLSSLTAASSYTLTVLSAKDATGNTIQEGVSGLKEFTTAETLKASPASPVLAAAGSDSSSGSTLSGTVVPTEGATKVATGAKENVIVLAALLLSLGIVAIYRRKLV